MSADPERLQTTLEELHRQLADIGPLDAALRDRLSAMLAELQAVLKSKQAPAKSLMPRLREAARGYEESHPTIAATIGSLIDVLARMGI